MTKILAIETSCDETAISIVNFKSKYKFEILSDIVLSQIDIHKEYGGVFPALAKREHTKNLYPLFLKSLKKAGVLEKRKKIKKLEKKEIKKLEKILDRDEENLKNLIEFFETYKKPKLSAVAITYGPGLEMSLWTGFNFAKALAEIWDITIVPVNHMEGHIFSSLILQASRKHAKHTKEVARLKYPALSVLISGGHTELILIKSEMNYELLGQTLDDAVGEAYDKTARLIGIDYPGGPEISKLAEEWEKIKKEKKDGALRAPSKSEQNQNNKKQEEWKSSSQLTLWKSKISLPRPMLNKNNFDFSFSGLKTAVLYLVRERKKIDKKFKMELAAEFENAVSEVLIKKTKKAIQEYKIKNLIIGGGVSANNRLRKDFKNLEKEFKNLEVFLPNKKYTGDNGLMIALAGFYRLKNGDFLKNPTKVFGNLKLKMTCKK